MSMKIIDAILLSQVWVFVPFYEGPMLFKLVPGKKAVKFEPAKFKRGFVCALVALELILNPMYRR